ncbi:MAG: bifunctional glutamate N-acetyltransferase/amino-acid acetyltransferase ArgJ [Butyrivibrio sp.]|jgi:glutamate N-acetyltransferase/amino-acid N-acetyltransferase|nr:bifunctional glutamate N-acetyltransferase/amino-acid acetyltransferase ArgJ [Butyrivibrio sp.]
MKIIEGGVTTAKGFKAAGYGAEIKYKNRNDMAMIFSQVPCSTAGVFTSNVVKAAPVMWDKVITREKGVAQAVVVNSGIANACTGKQGEDICRKTAEVAGKELGIPYDTVLIASTGVIGMQMPMDRVQKGVEALAGIIADTKEAGTEAAKAIMTTDTYSKEMALEFEVGGKTCHIGAMAKGSGMIHPNMCTMLCFVTTDVAISHDMLQKALSSVVVDTYNMISVDGDMSTNDSLMILANGMAENPEITAEGADYDSFYEALNTLCTEMAKKHAADGEGATALFECHVINADTKQNARILAKSVICSSLTKAAIFGHDANFGRILCALGYSGVDFDPDKVILSLESKAGSVNVYKEGTPIDFDEEAATKILSEKEVTAFVDMQAGTEEATAWGCDLTYDYVKINADYRS